jgi:hypothetical protein
MGISGMPGVDAQKTGENQPEARHYYGGPCQAQGDPWPWPDSADPVLQTEREAMAAGGGPVPAPHAEAIDRAAYDRFMRGLG